MHVVGTLLMYVLRMLTDLDSVLCDLRRFLRYRVYLIGAISIFRWLIFWYQFLINWFNLRQLAASLLWKLIAV